MLKTDRIYYLPPEFIIENFWTIDYNSISCNSKCGMYSMGYHTCDQVTKTEQWEKVLRWARNDEYYEQLVIEIATKGFLVPLAARANVDETITFYDGHHRICAAQDLDIVQVPVYIGPMTMTPEALVAIDSNRWAGDSLDSPFLGMLA